MSDMTTDGPLTGTPTRAKSGPPMREYYVYFAVIFAATLPLALLTWTLSAARQMALPAPPVQWI